MRVKTMSIISIKDIVIYGIFCVCFLAWIILSLKSKKYDYLFENLEKKDYPLKEVYSTGYCFLEAIGYKFTSKRDRKKRQELNVIYGEKYADYYLRVIYSQQVSLSFLVFLLSFCMYGFSQQLAVWVVMIAFAGVTFYYFGDLTSKKIRLRSEEMLSDFCEVVSKLALLTNAGMILHEAWEFVADSGGEGAIYKEMRTAKDEMNNGLADIEAIRRFGNRCIIPEIRKFTSTLIQGMVKGNDELVIMLQNQSSEVWGAKKQDVRRQGEKAASKLLIPMLLMFVGILIMVIVPIFANLGA